MKELRVTLYEILGYLIPGILALLATILAMWGRFWHTIDIDLVNSLSRRDIILLLLFAYLQGHIMQAIGNLIEGAPVKIVRFVTRRKESPDSRASAILRWFLCVEGQDDYKDAIPKSVSTSLEKTVRTSLGLAEGHVEARTLYRLCDAELLQGGATGTLDEREIYTYREGFYRGAAIGLFLVTACLLVSIFNKVHVLRAHERDFNPPAGLLLLAILMSAISSYLFYRRYRRFRQMRIAHGFLGCLSLITLQKAKAQEGEVKQSTNSS